MCGCGAALLLGCISTILEHSSRRQRQSQMYREKMGSVDSWLAERKFPPRLRRRIRTYYAEVAKGPALTLTLDPKLVNL